MSINFIFDDLRKKFPIKFTINNSGKFFISMALIPLDENGYPIVDCIIAAPGQTNGLALKALIDTGANRSAIKKAVFDKLNLKTKDAKAISHGFGAAAVEHTGYADITLNVDAIMGRDTGLDFTVLVEKELKSESIDNRPWDVVLGTDFLQHCNFEYRGTDRNYCIELARKPQSNNLSKSQKSDLLLQILYKKTKIGGMIYPLQEFEELNVYIGTEELRDILDDFKSQRFATYQNSGGTGFRAQINDEGVRFVENNSFSSPGNACISLRLI